VLCFVLFVIQVKFSPDVCTKKQFRKKIKKPWVADYSGRAAENSASHGFFICKNRCYKKLFAKFMLDARSKKQQTKKMTHAASEPIYFPPPLNQGFKWSKDGNLWSICCLSCGKKVFTEDEKPLQVRGPAHHFVITDPGVHICGKLSLLMQVRAGYDGRLGVNNYLD
jgi:hypothetical protein